MKFNVFVNEPAGSRHVDKIADYWDGRYLSTPEATWRILGYHLTKKDPAVTALPVHLPSASQIHRQYHRHDRSNEHTLSLLEHYFHRPRASFLTSEGLQRSFESLTYAEYFMLFRLTPLSAPSQAPCWQEINLPLHTTPINVIQRQTQHPHLTRLHSARPSEGEHFYLHAILQHCPILSFIDALTVDTVTYKCYQDAANALGLFTTQNEGELALAEVVATLSTPFQL